MTTCNHESPEAEVWLYRGGERRAAHLSDAAVLLLTEGEREAEGLVVEPGGRILMFASPAEARRRRALVAAAGPDPDARHDDGGEKCQG